MIERRKWMNEGKRKSKKGRKKKRKKRMKNE